MPKPVIAAVNGVCVGGGNELNILCDISICVDHSSLITDEKLDTSLLITHRMPLKDFDKAYGIFERKEENVIKIFFKALIV